MSLSRFAQHRVDVLIPVFNAEATIAASVRSILAQSITAIRVIVVDDGSTDGTAAILANLGARDSRLVVHRQSNGGIVDALNNGLTLCTSEWVARHDADDLAFPERFEKQLAYLQTHPDCIAVGTNAFHVDETGRRTGNITSMGDPALADVNRIPAHEPHLMHPFLMVRRDNLLQVGGYRHVFHAEDADLYWRLSSIGRMHNMTDILGEYRIHSNSVSGRSILNGRIQSVHSQLAAVSQRRRVAGRPDLSFPASRLLRFQDARTLPKMMLIAEEELHPDEFAQFRLSVVAKLFESESYRPYALEREDRAFGKHVFSKYSNLLCDADRQILVKRQAKYITKRIRRRDFQAAMEFFRPALLPTIGGLAFHAVSRRFRTARVT